MSQIAQDVAFPLATSETMHYAPPHGFVLVWIAPERFLEVAPPLRLPDEESDGYIKCFVEHIREGWPLDAPWLSLEDHDGRHRATAAKLAGVKRLPVYMEPDGGFIEFVTGEDCDL